jgi:hypothetical protein
MPSSKYHRDQAQILAGLALSTNNRKMAERFTLAAIEHLERAEATEGPALVQASQSANEQSSDRTGAIPE